MKEQIINKIKESDNIAIAMHDSPDADCIGSAFALKQALKNIGKDVDVILQNKISTSYLKIIGSAYINKINLPNKFYDLLIILDCSTIDRTIDKVGKYANYIIAIDHHIGHEPYGNRPASPARLF